MRKDWLLLGIFAACYSAVFFYYYPLPVLGIDDEVGFYNQAVIWTRGALSSESAGFSEPYGLQDLAVRDGLHIPYRHPGRSIALAPFLLVGGMRAVFMSGWLIQLAQTWVTARTFTQLGLSPLWALLVLFHPTFLLYSRTMMADSLAGLCVSLAALALFWPRIGGYIVGSSLGLAIATRFQVGILLFSFASLLLCRLPVRHSRGSLIGFVVTIAIVGGSTAIYNWALHGAILGHTFGDGYMSVRFVPRSILYYGGFLMVLWPFSVLAPLLDHSPFRIVANAIVWPFVAVLLCYHHYLFGPSWLQTIVVEERLLQPVLPVLIVSYGWALNQFAAATTVFQSPRLKYAFAMAAGTILLGTQIAMFQAHQAHLSQLIAIRDELFRRVPNGSALAGNSTLGKLIDLRIPGQPVYRWTAIDLNDSGPLPADALIRDGETCYVGVALKGDGDPLPPLISEALRKYHFTPVETGNARLALFRHSPGDLQ